MRWIGHLYRAMRGSGLPDVIVRNPRGAPVVVETEYLPARTVEQDAIQRLGRILAGSGAAIEQCVALRAPEALREAPQAELDAAVAVAAYEYCLFSSGANDGEHVRWPSAGWITGDVDDLATVLESAAISERVVAYSLAVLEQGIGTHPGNQLLADFSRGPGSAAADSGWPCRARAWHAR